MRRVLVAVVFVSVITGGVTGYMIRSVTNSEPTIRLRSPIAAHERRVAGYSAEDRKVLDSHIRTALDGLEDSGDPLVIALALNAYTFDHFKRVSFATGISGVDLLERGEAVCGGMAITIAEMLHASDITNRLTYLVGGGVAHSMVEARLTGDERVLLDPYHGIAYLDSKVKHRPLSLEQVMSAVAAGRRDIVAVYDGHRADGNIFAAYVPLGNQVREMTDYSLLSFEQAHGAGVSHAGYVHRVVLDLEPGMTLGSTEWKPDSKWPRPWTELSTLKGQDGEYISWAYQLGDNLSMGYRVRHTYRLSSLVAGNDYELAIHFAAAYAIPEISETPLLNIHRVDDRANGSHIDIGIVSPDLKAFEPHVVLFTFTARHDVELFLAELSGIGTISAIGLQLKAARRKSSLRSSKALIRWSGRSTVISSMAPRSHLVSASSKITAVGLFKRSENRIGVVPHLSTRHCSYAARRVSVSRRALQSKVKNCALHPDYLCITQAR